MIRILVVGSTGVLGRNVLPRLVERGHQVRAIVRRPEQADMLNRMGVEPAMGDILRPDTLLAATSGCEAVLHLATAIPKAGRPQDWSLNDRIRREGTQNLLSACQKNKVDRYIQQSVTLVYGDQGSTQVDETHEMNPAPFVQSAADMEGLVQKSKLDWRILRGGLFYGPGTWREEGWRQAARDGSLRWPGDGNAYLSLIHVVDMARAVVLAVELADRKGIYNVVDDQPVTFKDLYRYIAASVGGQEPCNGEEPALLSLSCSNRKIQSDLAWAPAFSTFRSGLAA